MRAVVLHGSLGKKHGRSFQLDVVSLADAMRALGAQLAGFRKAIHDGHFRVIVRRDGKDVFHVGEDEIGMRLPKGDLHVVPVVQGAKKGMGIGKIIAGILIAAVAWWNPAGLFTAAGVVGSTGLASGNVMLMGLGVAVAGLSQVLSPAEKPKQKDGNSDSFIFDGIANTGEQGVAVPLIYGEIMVTDPTPISAGMATAAYRAAGTSDTTANGLANFGWKLAG